jgi:hypothetical protein
MNKQRITVQVLSMIDGSFREVVANVPAKNAQQAVDKLFALAKDEKAYRFMDEHGVITPTDCPIPAITTKYAAGEWWTRA